MWHLASLPVGGGGVTALLRRVPPMIGRFTRRRPVPLAFWSVLERLGRRDDSLAPSPRPTRGEDLSDPVLAVALHGRELGIWTLGPASIDILRRLLVETQPGVVLEFGSGVSTICLARFASLLDWPVTIVSIEQDATEVEKTTALVAALPDPPPVTILHAPLEARIVEGRRLSSYSLTDAELDAALGGKSIDLVVIDGPSAEAGARFGTLPLVQSRLSPNAVVVLDDALRDGELSAVRRWIDLGMLEVDGIIAVEHGLLVGRVPPARTVRAAAPS